MTNDIQSDLLDDGFAIVRGALTDFDFEPVVREFTQLMNDRVAERERKTFTVNQADYDRTDIRTGLVDLARFGDFADSLLGELDLTLPHQPWAIIKPDSPFHVGPALLALITHNALLNAIEPVVGQNVTLSPNGHARYKLPSATGGTTPWHRDAMTHVSASDPVTVLTCWVPMGDVGEDNGCLVAVPGGHRSYPDLGWPLDPDVVQELDAKSVALPARLGDVVLLDKNVPHASLPNRSSTLRWSFDLRYHPTGEPGDRPWFPSLEVRRNGRNVPVDVDVWRQSWEAARDGFAVTGAPVPGRPEYARAVAEQRILSWVEKYGA